MFPPGSAISLLPARTSTGVESVTDITDSYLRFGCRTQVPGTASQGHAYPPSRSSLSSQSSISVGLPHDPVSTSKRPESTDTPISTDPAHDITAQGDPATVPAPPTSSSPTSIIGSPPSPPAWQVTHYILKDGEPDQGQFAHLHHHHHLRSQPSHSPHTSLLHRAIAPITRLSNSSSNHFYIVPEAASNQSLPLIVFTDSTPVLSAIPSGTLTVNEQEICVLGVEMTFWIAVSLAYLDYLRDQDVSLPPHLVELCSSYSTSPRVFWPPAIGNLIYVFTNPSLEKCRFNYIEIVMLARPLPRSIA
jgi:hypothetical protein